MLKTFPINDRHGQKTLGGTQVPKREILRLGHRSAKMHHRPRNGAYDAVTHYHVLDGLMRVVPGQTFRTRELIGDLTEEISWDAATVGRVINDIAETLFDAYDFKVIAQNRRFDGMWFDVSGHPEARAAMKRLLEDLASLSEAQLEEEAKGKFAKRISSPMEHCPSVML
jgi:hypothetical protein